MSYFDCVDDDFEYEGDYEQEEELTDVDRNSLRSAIIIDNPKIYPCPKCKTENALTKLDVAAGYVCDTCADKNEGWGF